MTRSEQFLSLSGFAHFLLFLAIAVVSASGQIETPSQKDAVGSPDTERFVAADGAMIPWISSDHGCRVSSSVPTPDCRIVTMAEYLAMPVLALHNSDGSIWYQVIVNYDSPDHYLRKPKADFKPYAATELLDDLSDSLVLRLVAESPHWYQVEVNEDTRATKYILKSDKAWTKVGWAFFFSWSFSVQVDQNRVKLRDKPDGQVIKEYEDLYYDRLKFLKLDGDWMYVEGIREARILYYGWIRWRKGREILVGSVLNNRKIPRSADEEDK